MSEKTYFTVVVPLDESQRQMARDSSASEALRCAVWSLAAEQLKKLLGKTCSQFSPAMSPYGTPMFLPYGVALGATESMPFLLCYMSAREQQENEIKARVEQIRGIGKVLYDEKLNDGHTISVTAYRSNDPELQKQMELARRFFSNDITAATGLYYLGGNTTFINEQQEQHILSNLNDYALCVVELQPLEGRV